MRCFRAKIEVQRIVADGLRTAFAFGRHCIHSYKLSCSTAYTRVIDIPSSSSTISSSAVQPAIREYSCSNSKTQNALSLSPPLAQRARPPTTSAIQKHTLTLHTHSTHPSDARRINANTSPTTHAAGHAGDFRDFPTAAPTRTMAAADVEMTPKVSEISKSR